MLPKIDSTPFAGATYPLLHEPPLPGEHWPPAPPAPTFTEIVFPEVTE